MNRPLLSPDVGDVVFNLSLGGLTNYFRRMRVAKVTPTQIETVDVMRRRNRYWRKNGYQIGNSLNCLILLEPPSHAREPKHEIGRPLPELESL